MVSRDWCGSPEEYWFSCPADQVSDWETLIYHAMQYLLTDQMVVDHDLFDDDNPHQGLNLPASQIWFSCWYGVWQADPHAFEGTAGKFIQLWATFARAARRVAALERRLNWRA